MSDEIITTLIGVGTTIAGTILGWALNTWSNHGRLNIFVSDWADNFLYNEMGSMVPCSEFDNVESFQYKVSLNLYNSGGNIKIMRNIQIVFSDGENDIKSDMPFDDATKKYFRPITSYDKVGVINIPPKSVITLALHNNVWNKNDELDFIFKSKKIYLAYTDEKNKVRRKLLKIINYENRFTAHKQENK